MIVYAMDKNVLSGPRLLSFDVFGTLIDVRSGSYPAFQAMVKMVAAR